jgi:hypothetical protein
MAYTTIDDASQYFQAQTYTGNAGVNNIVNTGNSDLQPDWVWIKSTDLSQPHTIRDSSRGTNKFLYVSTADEGTNTYLTSFNSDGFSLNATDNEVNGNSNTYVAWQWKVDGGTRTTFTESGSNPGGGRQVNQTAGISIIDYTGTGSNGTIAHGLSGAPNLVIVKNRDGGNSDSWFSHWTDIMDGDNRVVYLNNTDPQTTNATAFNSTKPDSSNITVGTNSATNKDGDAYIMYAIQNIKGYSKVVKYEGQSQSGASAPFIYLGFKPKYCIIINAESGSRDKTIWDSGRHPFNPKNIQLYLNLNNAHDSVSTSSILDFCSNGIKIRGNNQKINGGSDSMFIWAIAEHPFVSSQGVPATAV